MPKKKEKKKAGLGAAKTLEKQKKKESKQRKKETGEDDIEKILAELTLKDTQRAATTITRVPTPSPRTNLSMTPYDNKLYLFGGECFNGRTTSVYGDLFVFDTAKREWTQIVAPSPPPPRSAHIAAAIDHGSYADIFVFGGEFQSPTATQFYHYKDIHYFNTATTAWTQHTTSSSPSPSARSGHRCIVYKACIYVFGGFHDDMAKVKFYNDLWMFDTAEKKWTQIKQTTTSAVSWPSARSGFVWVVDEEHECAYLYGGVCNETVTKTTNAAAKSGKKSAGKADKTTVTRSVTLNDLWHFDLTSNHWSLIKKRGVFPALRSGMNGVSTKTRAFMFGGVTDLSADDDDEDDTVTHYNDLFVLDYQGDNAVFHAVDVKGDITTAFEAAVKQKVKKSEKKEESTAGDTAANDESSIYDFVPVVETAAAKPVKETEKLTSLASPTQHYAVPTARRSSSLAVLDNRLYVFGGVREGENGRESVYGDLWSIDISRGGQQWNCLESGNDVEWIGSDDDDDDDEKDKAVEDEKADEKNVDDEQADEKGEERNIATDDENKDSPSPKADESLADFFSRTKDHWMLTALAEFSNSAESNAAAKDKFIRKRAFELCSERFDEDDDDDNDDDDEIIER